MPTTEPSGLELRELKDALEEFFSEMDGSDVEWMFSSLPRLREASKAVGVEGNPNDEES